MATDAGRGLQGEDLGIISQKPCAVRGDLRGHNAEILDFSAADFLNDASKTYYEGVLLLR